MIGALRVNTNKHPLLFKLFPHLTVTHSHNSTKQFEIPRDPEGRIFLSHPHTISGFLFLLIIVYFIFIFKKTFPEVPDYAET